MPIYEYLCRTCGHELEALQKIAEEPLRYCPGCGEDGLKRKVSAAGFRLKGSGWYETDFKNKGKGKDKDKDKDKSEDKGKEKDDSKGDKGEPKAKEKDKDKSESATKKTGAESGSGQKSAAGGG